MQALHRPVKSRAAAIIPTYLYPANPANPASRITHHASRIIKIIIRQLQKFN